MNEVFLDLETKKWFDEVGRRDPAKLGVSFVGIYVRKIKYQKSNIKNYQGLGAKTEGEFLGFFEEELVKLWPILQEADLIVGYNIKKFDYLALSPYYPGKLDRLPTLDLLELVKETLGIRLKLNDLALATLGVKKSRPGSESVWLFKEGKLDELRDYCLNDVKITRDLYDYLQKFGELFYLDERGEKKAFKVNLTKWWPKEREDSKIQMSLGV